MKQGTKETATKERIIVLEKGRAIDVGPLAFCCFSTFMPIRGW
jgi:hypothetical protein